VGGQYIDDKMSDGRTQAPAARIEDIWESAKAREEREAREARPPSTHTHIGADAEVIVTPTRAFHQ
jgi:hypothetical protein